MSCNTCETKCEVSEIETKVEERDYIVSHSENTILDGYIEDNKKTAFVVFKEPEITIKMNDTVIVNVDQIDYDGKMLTIKTNGCDTVTLLAEDKVLHIFETDTSDLFICNLTSDHVCDDEIYPLYDINLNTVYRNGEERPRYVCNINMIAFPGNTPKLIHSLSGYVAEQLLFKAQYIIYEMELLKDLLKDIESDKIRYLIYNDVTYKILKNGYSGIHIQNVDKEDEKVSLPYMNISRLSNVHFLSNDSLYYINGTLMKDNGKDIIVVEKDIKDTVQNISNFLVLCNKTIEEINSGIDNKITVTDIQTQFNIVESELKSIGVGKDNIESLVLFTNGSNSWNKISLYEIESILSSTIKSIENK